MINIRPAEGSSKSTRLLLFQLKMTHDLSTWVPPHIQKHAQSLCSLLSQPVAVWRNVPFRSNGRVVSSGEFPVGMSHDEGGVVGGIVRLDLNPLALAAARPQDKLACGIWTYKNATWTFHKNCLKSFFFNHRNATTGKASFILLTHRCSNVQDLLICQIMKRGSEKWNSLHNLSRFTLIWLHLCHQ